MCGSRSATTVRLWQPPAPTNRDHWRHATRSHPHPSPSQTGSRAAEPPPRFGRNFFGMPERRFKSDSSVRRANSDVSGDICSPPGHASIAEVLPVIVRAERTAQVKSISILPRRCLQTGAHGQLTLPGSKAPVKCILSRESMASEFYSDHVLSDGGVSAADHA
jgi:hypothetical protein